MPPDASDISVVKSGTQIDENGQIVYTATVSSMNGTTNPVKITDTMQNVELVSGISIKGSDGTPYTPTIKNTANGFELELPPMAANSSYEITYTCELPEGYKASKTDIDTNNTLHAESEKENGHKTEASDDHEVKYVQQFLEKVGFRNDTGNITWQITVNAAQQNITGWTLTDLFNGSKLGSDMLVGDITMTDSDGIVTKIPSLDSYTFTGSKKYTITYQTKAQSSAGTSDAINKVILTDPKDPTNPVEKEFKVQADKFEPVNKVAGDMTIDKEHDIVIIDWTVNITGPLSENWIYKDTIKYEHDGKGFLTDEQYAVLEQTVKEAFRDYDVCEFKTERGGWGTNVITSFEFKCRKPLPAGKTITFSYQSAGRFEGGKTNWTFKNTGMINNTGGSSAEKHYKPLLQKHDKNQPNQETTTKNCKDTVDNLNWLVKISSDGLPDSDIKVVEQLPEGTELVSLKFQLQPTFWDRKLEVDDSGPKNTELQIWDYSSGAGTLTASYTISVMKDGNNIFITIPKELIEYAGETQIEFFIEAKVDEEFLKPTDNKYVTTGTFKNTVTLITPDDKVLDTTWQTQVVTKDTWKPPLKKEASSENNRITYQLKINPNGEDLVEGTDTLTLTDTLTVDSAVKDNQGAHQYEVRYKLNPDSLKIYELNPDGTKGNELNPSDYPYTYAETIHPTDPNKHLHTIKMTVDDEKPLLVEYMYIAYVDDSYQGGTDWNSKAEPTISNEASLDGVANTSNENKKEVHFELVKSEASAGTTSVTVYKHDSDNYSKPLGGAKFHLYKYDKDKKAYIPDIDTETGEQRVIVTKADGSDLGKAIPTVDLNVAYYIQEFEPPQGYLLNDKPYYFMVYDGSEKALQDHPETAPDDFNGEKLISGQLLPIPNESTTTSIKVQKIWQDKKNKPYEPQVHSITVNLKCKAYNKATKEFVQDVNVSTLTDIPDEYKSPISISADLTTGIWQRSITGLPRYGKIGEQDVYYTYYVEEVNNNPDIEVTYSVESPGITTGTITITNTVDTSPKHELPQTGGEGTSPITALGGGVIAITLILALIKRLQDKKVRESG